MANNLSVEFSQPTQELGLEAKTAGILKLANEIALKKLGKLYAGEYGIFAPAAPADIRYILSALQLQPDQQFVDLGSGDGRWVFTAAALGLKAEGYELDPKVYAVAKQVERQLGRTHLMTTQELARVSLHNRNLLSADLSRADAILYWSGSGAGSSNVEAKILTDGRAGAKVVIYGYKDGFEKLQPIETNSPRTFVPTKSFVIPPR